jgi:sodium/potassium/calcium exchanger 2
MKFNQQLMSCFVNADNRGIPTEQVGNAPEVSTATYPVDALAALHLGTTENAPGKVDRNITKSKPPRMSWRDTLRNPIIGLLVFPIILPLRFTLPDTRTPNGKKWFPLTFIGSIVWIAAYSYLMVWWACVVGEMVGFPPEMIGFIFLAAGTSIPIFITSVYITRKGFGNVAVSNIFASNIFCITVGLPVPWLIYGITYGQSIKISSYGIDCSIIIIIIMLLIVLFFIAVFRWKINKGLGFTMCLLYFIFITISIMFEYSFLSCPF